MCVSLQEVYSGPLRFVSDTVFDDPWSHLFMTTLGPRKYIKVQIFFIRMRRHQATSVFTGKQKEIDLSSVSFYCKCQVSCCTVFTLCVFQVSSIRMQGLLLLFFSKLDHVPFIRDIQATYTRTGIFGYWVRNTHTHTQDATD